MTTLKDLAGEHVFDFAPNMEVRHPISADASGVMFGLDGNTYLVFEDENDGYRSSAGPLLSFDGPPYMLGGSLWPEHLTEKVICSHETRGECGGENDILCARSAATGEIIFRVGTENIDDYYPGFIADWRPAGLSANATRTR